MIKPDGVARGLTAEIERRIAAEGMTIERSKTVTLTAEQFEVLYGHTRRERPGIYEAMKANLTCCPSKVMVVRGTEAVKQLITLRGSSNPAEARPGTIRGDYAKDQEYARLYAEGRPALNVFHCPDTAEGAAREIKLFFSEYVRTKLASTNKFSLRPQTLSSGRLRMSWEEISEAYEAEGSMSIRKEPGFQAELSIENNVKEYIEDICESIGLGRVCERRREDGTVSYYLSHASSAALHIISKMRDHMLLKRAQADIMIAHLRDQNRYNLNEMKHKNKPRAFIKLRTKVIKRRLARYKLMQKLLALPDKYVAKPWPRLTNRALAAFLDGEACITITKKKEKKRNMPRYAPRVIVGSVSLSKLHQISAQYGGSIAEKSVGYQLEINGQKAERLIKRVFPYLRIKDLQAWLFLCYRDWMRNSRSRRLSVTERRLRDEVVLTMKAMHELDSGKANSVVKDFSAMRKRVETLVFTFLSPETSVIHPPAAGRFARRFT